MLEVSSVVYTMSIFVKYVWLLLASISSFGLSSDVANSLEYYLCHGGLYSNMAVTLSSQRYYTILPGPFCLLENLTNVTIQTDDLLHQTLITCSLPWRGFGFFNISNLHLRGLTFHQCGGLINLTDAARDFTNSSELYLGPYQRAVLLFSYCHNVSLKSVSVKGPYGGFGMILMNVMGVTSISNVFISENGQCLLENSTRVSYKVFNFSCSGSGLVIIFTDKLQPATSQTIIANNVTLAYNTHIISIEEPYTDIALAHCQPIITAAGISIIQSNVSYTVLYALHNVTIMHNIGGYGVAGFLILDRHQRMGRGLILLSKLFLNDNRGFGIGDIGGLSIHIIEGLNVYLEVNFLNSSFMDNHGMKVGSLDVSVISSIEQSHETFYLNVGIYGTHFRHCRGMKESLCINVQSMLSNYVNRITSFIGIQLYGATFERNFVYRFNSAISENEEGDLSLPIIKLVNVNKLIVRNSIFRDNLGSVFYAFNSFIKLKELNYFIHNRAVSGACFKLKSLSQLLLYDTNTTFLGNTALKYGGAIYSDTGVSSVCPFEFPNRANVSNIKLLFINNTASLSGDAIYATNIYNCF